VGERSLAVAAASVDDDDGGAVLGRPVPARDVEAVAGLERDVAVGADPQAELLGSGPPC
jgi:hypothetical protein